MLFLAGAVNSFYVYPDPYNLKTTAVKISMAVLSLDVVFMVAGVFLILIAWVFTRLNQ